MNPPIVKKLKSRDYPEDKFRREERERMHGKPKLFLKAGVTNRDTFQTMVQKVTGNGRDLIEFAYGVLMANTVKEIPTSYGKRQALVYNDIEITVKEKIWAIEYLTNRGFGKAEQNINISATIENKSTDELKQEALKLLHKVAKVQDAIEPPKTVVDLPIAQAQAETPLGASGG